MFIELFFAILCMILLYACFNKRINIIVDKTLQVYELKLDNILKEKGKK